MKHLEAVEHLEELVTQYHDQRREMSGRHLDLKSKLPDIENAIDYFTKRADAIQKAINALRESPC